MSETETKIINIKDRNFKNKLNGLMRVDQKNQSNLYNIVFNIIQKIQKLGDSALIEFVNKFDSKKINKIEELYISKDVLKNAYNLSLIHISEPTRR